MVRAAEVKFGVEVECFVPQAVARRFPAGGYHRGTQLPHTPEGWNGQRDGSIHPEPGYSPVEVVSPTLAGEQGLTEVFYILETLRAVGARVNGSTGLHVHVDASQLTYDQINDLKATFTVYEKAFYGLCGETAEARWHNTTYCARSDRWYSNGCRYQSLNVSNWYPGQNEKNTVEVRVFGGRIDAEYVVTAIHMAVSLVAGIRNGQKATGGRIENPVEAARAFIGAYWSKLDNRIVPDCSTAEMARILLDNCRQANI